MSPIASLPQAPAIPPIPPITARRRSLERVLCLNETDGQVLWKHEYECPYTISYPAGPRVAPMVSEGKVYTLGAEGNLLCLDAASGRVLWSRDFKKDFGIKAPVWGFAGHPLLDGNRLICLAGGPGSTAVAFDKDTGEGNLARVKRQRAGLLLAGHLRGGRQTPAHPLASRGRQLARPGDRRGLLVCAVQGAYGHDHRHAAQDGRSALLHLLLQRLPHAAARPGQTRRHHALAHAQGERARYHPPQRRHVHPFLEDGYIYGVCSYGQLRCLKADTGERVWETFQATTSGEPVRWANAFIVKNGERFFLFNEKGDLIIAKLSPRGYEEISRAHLLEPTGTPRAGRWCGRTRPLPTGTSMRATTRRSSARTWR